MNPSLFGSDHRIWLIEPDVWLMEQAFRPQESSSLLPAIDEQAAWEQHEIQMFGRRIKSPRLTAFQADAGVTYSYSGITLRTDAWSDAVARVRARVEQLTNRSFNSVLLNKYRDGSDSMGWHADDEPELGHEPAIASVTFGGARRFVMRHNDDGRKVEALLGDGSLLLMEGRSQHDWKHAVPKTKKEVDPRINLTFRWIEPE